MSNIGGPIITYDDIERVNKEIKPTEIKGKLYAEVNQRIKAFRKIYPRGRIVTELLRFEQGVVIMKSVIYDGDERIIATGLASEKEGSSSINKTSFIENCETSAVGRALGMCGFGIDCAISSKEEMENKELTKDLIEKELEKQSVEYIKLRTTLKEMKCDFRNIETNAWILEEANMKAKENEILDTQDLQDLSLIQLRRLNATYRGMIAKKKQKEIDEANTKIVENAGKLGNFSD